MEREKDCIKRKDGSYLCWDRKTGTLVTFKYSNVEPNKCSPCELAELMRKVMPVEGEINE